MIIWALLGVVSWGAFAVDASGALTSLAEKIPKIGPPLFHLHPSPLQGIHALMDLIAINNTSVLIRFFYFSISSL